jgi:hypothetical protein
MVNRLMFLIYQTKSTKPNKIDKRVNDAALLPVTAATLLSATVGGGLVLCCCEAQVIGCGAPWPCSPDPMRARSGHPARRGGVGGWVQRCVPCAMEEDRGIGVCR